MDQQEQCRSVALLLRIQIQTLEGVVAQWCNPQTLQPEQSGGVGLRSQRLALNTATSPSLHLHQSRTGTV